MSFVDQFHYLRANKRPDLVSGFWFVLCKHDIDRPAFSGLIWKFTTVQCNGDLQT